MNTISNKRCSRRNLPHFEYPGDLVFITISNSPGIVLTPKERDLVFSSVKFYDQKLYSLHILVVMPNHCHFFVKTKINSLESGISMSEGVKRIKSYTTNQLRVRFRNEQHHWWLNDYFDKTIFDYDGFIAVRDYLRNNPVKAKLSSEASLYPWYYENL